RVSLSKRRSDIAVVACSPVLNANETGITRSAALMPPAVGRTALTPSGLTIINRFPILIGFESARANGSIQLRGNGSRGPPNFLSSAEEWLRDRHTISRSRGVRPGLRTTT